MDDNRDDKPSEEREGDRRTPKAERRRRRDFLRKMSLAGLTGGLTFFQLVGRKTKVALAANDACETAGSDACLPSQDNADRCWYTGQWEHQEVDDVCPDPHQQSGDQCPFRDTYEFTQEVGDNCTEPTDMEGDKCTITYDNDWGGFLEYGDHCPDPMPGATTGDQCNYGIGDTPGVD